LSRARFHTAWPQCCPHPEDLGYAASWWLLLAHIKYLKRLEVPMDVGTATAYWLLTDNTNRFPRANTGWRPGSWFRPGSRQARFRTTIAWASWIIAAVALAMLGAIILPLLLEAATVALQSIGCGVVKLFGEACQA
jgi:hypothetical protein